MYCTRVAKCSAVLCCTQMHHATHFSELAVKTTSKYSAYCITIHISENLSSVEDVYQQTVLELSRLVPHPFLNLQ